MTRHADPSENSGNFAHGGKVQLAEMNEALLIGGLHQHELRENAERLNEQLHWEISQGEEVGRRLRASETRYRRLFEAAKDGILIVDPETRQITDANPFICNLLEYSLSELIGRKPWTIGRPEDHALSVQMFADLHDRPLVRSENLPLLTKTGRLVPVEFVSNLYDEDGKGVIQCNIRDISERIKSSRDLRASEERYRVLCDALPVAAFVCDANAVIQYYNQRAVELWGRKPMIGKEQHWGSLNLRMPDGARLSPAQNPVMEVLQTGKARRNVEVLIEHLDGSRLPVNANFCALIDAHGTTTGVVASFDDISERKLAAEKLASHAARTALLSQAAAQLLIAESTGDLLGSIFSRFAREIGAECVFHHIAPGDGTLKMRNAHGLSSRQLETLQVIPIGTDLCGMAALSLAPIVVNDVEERGRETFVLMRSFGAQAYACYPLKAGQHLYGTITFVAQWLKRFSESDVTFISALCDLVAAGEDRQRLLEESRAARDAAQEANRAKDNFLAALSHELRTPLNPILLLATAAATDPNIPADIRADFDLIAKNVLLEARLIDDLLDSTRIAHGKLVLDLQLLLANDVVKDAIANIRSEVDEKRLTLDVEFDATNPTVEADSVRLQQIFWNVLKNAVKFTPPGGRVSIRTSIDATLSRLVVEIADSGAGMTPAELERVFDAFKQGDHAGRAGSKTLGGLGLGLAISRSLAELHSGTIRATSGGPGSGSVFTITLPIVRRAR